MEHQDSIFEPGLGFEHFARDDFNVESDDDCEKQRRVRCWKMRCAHELDEVLNKNIGLAA